MSFNPHSYSGLITSSSTEVFVLHSKDFVNMLREMLERSMRAHNELYGGYATTSSVNVMTGKEYNERYYEQCDDECDGECYGDESVLFADDVIIIEPTEGEGTYSIQEPLRYIIENMPHMHHQRLD